LPFGAPPMPRGGSNYIPRPDGGFDSWVRNFGDALNALGPGLGVAPVRIGIVLNAIDDWQNLYAAHVAATAAARSAAADKDGARPPPTPTAPPWASPSGTSARPLRRRRRAPPWCRSRAGSA